VEEIDLDEEVAHQISDVVEGIDEADRTNNGKSSFVN